MRSASSLPPLRASGRKATPRRKDCPGSGANPSMIEAVPGCQGRGAASLHEWPLRAGHATLRGHVTASGSRQAPTDGPAGAPAGAAADSREAGAADSRAWIDELRSEGPQRDEAIGRLHALLLRAARFEVARRARMVPHLRGGDLDDIALQSANDALIAVLAKLDTFRGESRFSTWAYKFALLESAVKVRRLAWQGREIPVEPEEWPRFADRDASPQAQSE